MGWWCRCWPEVDVELGERHEQHVVVLLQHALQRAAHGPALTEPRGHSTTTADRPYLSGELALLSLSSLSSTWLAVANAPPAAHSLGTLPSTASACPE